MFKNNFKQLYTKLESEDHENLIPNQDAESGPGPKRKQSYHSIGFWICQVFGCLILLSVGVWIGRQYPLDMNRDIIPRVSQNSPILEDLDIRYNVIQFNGSFLEENIYRQDASPEVDAAWESLGADYRSVVVPEHLAEKVGLAPDQVKIRQKYGGGYPVNVEGLHHLHCLNLLRKGLYYNYDYYQRLGLGAFKNEDHIVRKHVSHCLDILRQQLMCTVDIGVLGQVWYNPGSLHVEHNHNHRRESHEDDDHNDGNDDDRPENFIPNAFTDFNTLHKCRNFDAIRQWAEVRQLPDDVPIDFLEPPKKGDRVYNGVP